jgi:hypothetical protein
MYGLSMCPVIVLRTESRLSFAQVVWATLNRVGAVASNV